MLVHLNKLKGLWVSRTYIAAVFKGARECSNAFGLPGTLQTLKAVLWPILCFECVEPAPALLLVTQSPHLVLCAWVGATGFWVCFQKSDSDLKAEKGAGCRPRWDSALATCVSWRAKEPEPWLCGKPFFFFFFFNCII
jgi:hypothetical protein